MDLIICRNVMIYFKPALNTAITRRFYRSLNNGGYLLVGHTESADYVYHGFQKEIHPGAYVYQKREQWTEADRSLRIRFRGTGHLPGNIMPTWRSKAPPPPKAPKPDFERLPVTRETILFEEAAQSHRNGKIRQAMDKFRDVLAINPKNHRALYMMAMMEADQNHLRKASEYCLEAIAAHPLSLEAHYLLAVIAREEGMREKELEYLKKVLYINRDFVLGHFQMGVYYLREGTYPLAKKFFNNALKVLEKWDEIDYIEGIEGMTVGRLRQIIQKDLEEIEQQGPLVGG
jgi:chemotaxis protein methyltransferase CheR